MNAMLSNTRKLEVPEDNKKLRDLLLPAQDTFRTLKLSYLFNIDKETCTFSFANDPACIFGKMHCLSLIKPYST